VLGAAQADALGAEGGSLLASRGLSALASTFRRRAASAQPMRRLKFLLPVAATVGIWPA